MGGTREEDIFPISMQVDSTREHGGTFRKNDKMSQSETYQTSVKILHSSTSGNIETAPEHPCPQLEKFVQQTISLSPKLSLHS